MEAITKSFVDVTIADELNQQGDDGWETVEKKPTRPSYQLHKQKWQQYKANASEQEYADEVELDGSWEPTEEELNNISQAGSKLWELDFNRLVPGKDYEIDTGAGKKPNQKGDVAPNNLFSWLNDDVLDRPTIARFCSLLDNYNPNTGYKEVVTPEEQQEQAAFIEEICRTAPIKYLHKYLTSKGIISEDVEEFKTLLTGLWFDLYDRGGTSESSSAFEHVFVGEVKKRGQVSGFHNWLQFYLEEEKRNLDYQGYIFPKRGGEIPDSQTQLLTIQFEWNGVLKTMSSTLVGASPEFEIALYTLCFFGGKQNNRMELGPYPVNIKVYRLGEQIGSVFPMAEN